jgi:hypothetical protein
MRLLLNQIDGSPNEARPCDEIVLRPELVVRTSAP